MLMNKTFLAQMNKGRFDYITRRTRKAGAVQKHREAKYAARRERERKALEDAEAQFQEWRERRSATLAALRHGSAARRRPSAMGKKLGATKGAQRIVRTDTPIGSFGGVTQRGPPRRTPRDSERVLAVIAGQQHAAVVHRTRGLLTWGAGGGGRLGHGDTLDQPLPKVVAALQGVPLACVSLGRNHSAVVSAHGELYVWGSASSGQLGFPTQSFGREWVNSVGKTVLEVGRSHIGDVHCVLPTRLHIPAPGKPIDTPQMMALVACGHAHTVAVDVNGHAWVWGSSDGGRLGIPLPKRQIVVGYVQCMHVGRTIIGSHPTPHAQNSASCRGACWVQDCERFRRSIAHGIVVRD